MGFPSSADPDELDRSVRAYDTEGDLLNEWVSRDGKPEPEPCWSTPDGKHLSGYDDIADADCLPAPRWPMVR